MHGLRFLDFGLGGLLGSGFGFRVLGFGKLKVTSVLTDSTMEQRLDLATSGVNISAVLFVQVPYHTARTGS